MPSLSPFPADSRAAWLLPVLLFTLVWFAGLGARALWHPDEGRYGEIAREMQASGDYVTPRLSGLKYFEKPPLQYWLTALAYEAFGVREWTTRLAPALFGWIAVVAVGYAGMRIAGAEAGLAAGAVQAGSAWPIVLGHFVSLDAVLAGCLAVAFAAFLVAQAGNASALAQHRALWLAWLAVAAGVLAKGPVALVIPAGALVLYSLLARDLAVWRRLALVRGIALVVVVTAPWFLLVSARNPEFARFFFWHEHVERFLTTEHNREGAWWYFVPLLALGLLPWTGLALVSLRRMVADAPATADGFRWPHFCVAWSVFVFAFFSLSGSKLPSYILPLFPALSLLMARAIGRVSERMWRAALASYALGTLALAAALVAGFERIVPRLSSDRTPEALYVALGSGVKLGFAAIAASAVAAWVLARRGTGSRVAAAMTVALGMNVGLLLAVTGNDALSPSRSTRDLVAAVRADARAPFDPGAPFYQVALYDQTLPWYLRRVTTVVDYRDELGPGIDAEPARAIARVADWATQWRDLAQGYALLDHALQQRLAAEGLPMRVAAENARYVVIARR